MARKVFFCFNYEKDIPKVESVRNSWFGGSSDEFSGFIDYDSWEELKKGRTNKIQNWIDSQLEGSTVTVVLMGPEAAKLEWVRYAVVESHYRGNGMFGIYIDNRKDLPENINEEEMNPFELLTLGGDLLSKHYKTYDWIGDDGNKNFQEWIEKTAEAAGK